MGWVMKKGMRADDGDEGDDDEDADDDGYGEIFLLILKKGMRQVWWISRKMKMAILRGY